MRPHLKAILTRSSPEPQRKRPFGAGAVALGALLAFSIVAGCRSSSSPEPPCAPAPTEGQLPASPVPAAPVSPEPDFDPAPAQGGDERTPMAQGSSGLTPQSEPAGSLDALADLDRWARSHGGRARGFARDLRSGQLLIDLEGETPVNPASTQKLLTAGAALTLLGPSFRFRTELWLEPAPQAAVKKLLLVGGGAPDLSVDDLRRWVAELVRHGVKSVGVVEVDQSLFTSGPWPPAYEEQPGEWAAFRAPVSALALEKNTITLHVTPRASGEPALAWLSPPGLSKQLGAVETGPASSGDQVRWDLAPAAETPGLVSKLGGRLGEDAGSRSYPRRIEDPRLAAGFAFAALLEEAKINVREGVKPAMPRAAEAVRFGVIRSAPLAVLVRELGKDSDNFTAEMLTIALSTSRVAPGEPSRWSTERGVAVLKGWLTSLGLAVDGATIRNGSGLFGANKISCELIVGVLTAMQRGSAVAPEYLSQLAIGGVDGTLSGRFEKKPWAQRVRAKTGTLRDTDALAGYLFPAETGFPIAFALVVSGVSGQHAEVRKRVDRVVAALATRNAAARP